ncbi:hypothetical protein V6N13_049402 [Hibiscus sabdariffa]|uniref:Uncharacterized protein n=1 Tax=Hibiscus sabdariffa TaxID=183260 RepID=A0ABR2QY17_9ROSI
MKQWIYREKSEIEEISSVFRIIGETLSGLVAVTPHKGFWRLFSSAFGCEIRNWKINRICYRVSVAWDSIETK